MLPAFNPFVLSAYVYRIIIMYYTSACTWSEVEAAEKATGESIATAYRIRDSHRRGDNYRRVDGYRTGRGTNT